MENNRGLCYRCESRAKYLELGLRPRFECGEVKGAKYSCYMYKPVSPVTLKKNLNDDRPQFGSALISSRSSFNNVYETTYQVISNGELNTLFCVPKFHKIVKYSILDKIKSWLNKRKNLKYLDLL